MVNDDFYDILDNELQSIIDEHKDEQGKFAGHEEKGVAQQKGYAFLIWFLDFYARRSEFQYLITDGGDDNSCDIIFDLVNNQGEKIFYVIQSKWNTKKNTSKDFPTKEVKSFFNDIETIFKGGNLQKSNKKFNKQVTELLAHRKKNGKVKFIFLSLGNKTEKVDENIRIFKEKNQRTEVEFIDFNKIKRDYIDRHYKKIDVPNPLEFTIESPEETKVTLKIERLGISGNQIHINKYTDASIFLVRPSEIHRLFEKYGFTLFFKNVRNPLLASTFNKKIKDTIANNPRDFWYYNNGITAITYGLPEIASEAEEFEVMGFQIINGAQTVYAIYSAYEEASPTKRVRLDSEALVTLRLLKSGGRDFDLRVTRYTNSQNPISDRDFHANDEVQQRIQDYFFTQNIWYEKRRDEFREIPQNITLISNDYAANAYLAYFLKSPTVVIQNYIQQKETGKNLIFISHEQDKDGIYERVFRDDINEFDVLFAGQLLLFAQRLFEVPSYYEMFETSSEDVFDTPYHRYDTMFNSLIFHTLALFRPTMGQYLRFKNISEQEYISTFLSKNIEITIHVFIFIQRRLEILLVDQNDDKQTLSNILNFKTSIIEYTRIESFFEYINEEDLASIDTIVE